MIYNFVITRCKTGITKRGVSMKNTIKLFGIIALMALIVFSMASCKGKSGSASASAAASAAPASGNNWDTFLNEYEDFLLKEYIPLVEKMKNGDMTVYAQLQPLQTRLVEWAEKMEDFVTTVGVPTDAQAKRLQELSEKITASLQ